jgi:hypothetical protein
MALIMKRMAIATVLIVGIVVPTMVLFVLSRGGVGPNEDEPSSASLHKKVDLIPLRTSHFERGHVDFVPHSRIPNLERTYGRKEPFMVPKGTENVALNKPVTSSCPEPITGKLEMITDGCVDRYPVELESGVQHVTIDLEEDYDIYAIVFWHYASMNPVYFDVVVQISSSPDFTRNAETLFNNDHDNSAGLGVGTDKNYIECGPGKLVDAKGKRARYVRLYSNGNWAGEFGNHYEEVEVYGQLSKDIGKTSSSVVK